MDKGLVESELKAKGQGMCMSFIALDRNIEGALSRAKSA